MKPSIFLTSFAAALLLSPALGSAQPQEAPQNPPKTRRMAPGMAGAPGEGRGMMQRRQAVKAELGLTDAQKADIQKAMESNRRDRLRKTTDLKIAGLDLRSLLRAEKVDDKAVAARLAEAQAAQAALLKLRVDTALAMKRILTPEQQKKMGELRAGRGMQHVGQRMKMRGMGQGPGRMGRPHGRSGRPMMGRGGDDLDLDLDLDLESDLDLEGSKPHHGGIASR